MKFCEFVVLSDLIPAAGTSSPLLSLGVIESGVKPSTNKQPSKSAAATVLLNYLHSELPRGNVGKGLLRIDLSR